MLQRQYSQTISHLSKPYNSKIRLQSFLVGGNCLNSRLEVILKIVLKIVIYKPDYIMKIIKHN